MWMCCLQIVIYLFIFILTNPVRYIQSEKKWVITADNTVSITYPFKVADIVLGDLRDLGVKIGRVLKLSPKLRVSLSLLSLIFTLKTCLQKWIRIPGVKCRLQTIGKLQSSYVAKFMMKTTD